MTKKADALAAAGLQSCSRCKQTKSLEDFQLNRKTKRGRDGICLECRRAYAADYNNRPEVKARLKARIETTRTAGPKFTLQTSLLRALKRRPTDNPVKISELMDMWKAQEGKCAVTNLDMTWYKGEAMPTSVSIDRIDSSKGYTLSNVRLICYAINTFKGRWSDDHMFTMALALIANMKKPKLRLVS